MNPQDKEASKKDGITRGEFLKLGFAALAGGVALFISGCRQNASAANVPLAQYNNFIGDPQTRVYHKLKCKLAPDRSRGAFFDSPSSAQMAGFRPCGACKPDKP